MPKKTWKFEQFHGGLNNNASRRDIGQAELSIATDIMVDEPGKIRNMGSNVAHVSTAVPGATVIQPGYGLFGLDLDSYDVNFTNVQIDDDFDDGVWSASTGGTASKEDNWSTVVDSVAHTAYYKDDVMKLGTDAASSSIVWSNTPTAFDITDSSNFIIVFKFLTVAAFQQKISGMKVRVGQDVSNYYWWDILTNDFKIGEWNVVSLGKGTATEVGSATWTDIDYTAIEAISSASGGEFYIDGLATREMNENTVSSFDKFLFFTNANNLNIYSFNDNAWNQSLGSVDFPKTIGSTASDVKPVFTSVDGVLFIVDSHDSNTANTAKKLLYPGHTRFAHCEVAADKQLVSDWYYGDVKGTKPTTTHLQDAGDDWTLEPAAHSKVYCLFGESAGATGSWSTTKSYYVGTAYVYYNGDISEIRESSQEEEILANRTVEIGVVVGTDISNDVVGVKYYMRESTVRNTWWLVATFMLNGRCFFADETEPQGQNWDQAYKVTLDRLLESELEITTYEDETGISNGSELKNLRYKTSVIANRKMYIGNLMFDVDDTETVRGDTLCASPVNKFSTFSTDRFINAVINDGESIVKLEEYADRILQFKERTLYLLNVSQEIEFLEDKFSNKGVKHPAAVCRTDYGVAWVNRFGCYLYDGKQVHNILEKKGMKVIKPKTWEDFTTDTSTITYLPRKRQLIVLKDCTDANHGDIYLYDMVTQSWVEGNSAFEDGVGKTNFILDPKSNVVHVTKTGDEVVQWDDASAAKAGFIVATAAIDFGEVTQRKKIYKVYVTHKNSGSDVLSLKGEFHSQRATGGQGAGELSDSFTFGNLAPDSAPDNYITQEFAVPSQDAGGDPISFNSVYTLILSIEGAAPVNFEINDISIVYRTKSMK